MSGMRYQADPDRSCLGKTPHGDKRSAQAQVVRLRKSGTSRSSSEITPYKCGYCGEWHVGHRPRKDGKRTG